MAEDEKPDAASSAPADPPQSKGPLVIALINTIVSILVVLVAVYTQVLFKRPKILEEQEREALLRKFSKQLPPVSPTQLKFDKFVVNISSVGSTSTRTEDSLRPHYLEIGFTLELRHKELQPQFESIRSQFLDRLNSILGRKLPSELNTVQGRYVLRQDILNLVNQMLWRLQGDAFKPDVNESVLKQEMLALNVYFTSFMVQ